MAPIASPGITGRTYLEAGSPVVILAQWRRGPTPASGLLTTPPPLCRRGPGPRPTSPRNVLIRRADGSLVVRPFRGLRKTVVLTQHPFGVP